MNDKDERIVLKDDCLWLGDVIRNYSSGLPFLRPGIYARKLSARRVHNRSSLIPH